jgi:hypothetical protein
MPAATIEPEDEAEKDRVDYSAGKGGPLVAYRFDGEQTLSQEKFVWVP